MKTYKFIFAILPLLPAVGCTHKGYQETSGANPSDYVDPRIGTGDHGHVFVGASVPFGMVQLGPTQIKQEWDWTSGYHASDSTAIGFSHTHLSGTGIGDLFDITVMPVTGTDLTYARGNYEDQNSGLWSLIDKSKETIEPGYYSVPLLRYGIDAELTATERTGFHRYRFPDNAEAPALVFDLENGGCWDGTTSAEINVESPTLITGHRFSRGWANDQKVYFAAELSEKMEGLTFQDADSLYARIDLSPSAKEKEVLLKVAISPVSIEGAKNNLRNELPGWDFDAVRKQAREAWDNELSNVKIKTSDEDVKKIFYTALYHLMISPSIFCDYDGQYRGADGNIHKSDGFTPYTVMSLWDTYRAALPLMSVIDEPRYVDMINAMIDISDKQGRLPVWHLWSCETDCMVGNPGAAAVGEAVAKGIPGIDGERALKALLQTAASSDRAGGIRNKYGFIPSDLYNQSCAWDMEYAIADAAISKAAAKLGHKELADSFENRSHSYRQYFDSTTNFIRGRLSDGSWRTPFDPFSNDHNGPCDYTEGNAWHYTWLVPHDPEGLQQCFGSRDAMLAKLDSLFIQDSAINGAHSPDISGLIGQYCHGNEPSHHVLYLYAMLGQPDKTALRVRETLKEMYTTRPDGLCGNEDAGQMSAWYIFSALGLYPVEPASGKYWFGSPIVDEAEIKVPGGVFRIIARDNSPELPCIDKVWLNGKPYSLPYITHEDIRNGGTLEFQMREARQ